VASDPEAAEPDPFGTVLDTATFTFRRTGPVDDPLNVAFRLGGTATAGADYAEVPNVVTIPEGRHSVDVFIEPIDDELVEGDESVVAHIVPVFCPAIWPPDPNCYFVGRHHRARAVIHDNDMPPNHPPEVKLIHPVNGQVFRAPADILLVAAAADFDGTVVQVEFFEGDNSLGVVHAPEIAADLAGTANGVDINRDLFRLLWEDVPQGGYVLTAVATDDDGDQGRSRPVEIKVVEFQPPPIVTIEATDPEAAEPSLDPVSPAVLDTATFTISRTGPLQRPLTVYYRIHGTATNGEDYETLPGLATIPANRHCVRFAVVPIDDEIPEGRESVILGLFQPLDVEPPPYVVGRHGRAAAVIVDRDFDPPFCHLLPGGVIHICHIAELGETFQLEITDNMVDWEPLETMTAGEDGLHYVDPNTDGSNKCYRLVPVPADPMAIDD
jgi:hypothetical protein